MWQKICISRFKKYILKIKYPAKKPAKFLKPEPEPDIEAGYTAGSGFSRISGRFLLRTNLSDNDMSLDKLMFLRFFLKLKTEKVLWVA